MHAKHKKIFSAIFADPVPKNIPFRDIESLLQGIGCMMVEGEGSRVTFSIGSAKWHTHRPHPGKEILPYQIRSVRAFLEETGISI